MTTFAKTQKRCDLRGLARTKTPSRGRALPLRDMLQLERGFMTSIARYAADGTLQVSEKTRAAMNESCRRSRLRRKLALHGLTQEDYQRMLKAQGGVCAICGQPQTVDNKRESRRLLCVDHDHETGRGRALLCDPCNLLIGLVSDNFDMIERVVLYLQTH